MKWFHGQGMPVVGIDNDMRSWFFGPQASTASTRATLERTLPRYHHHAIDIRDEPAVRELFARFGKAIRPLSTPPRNRRMTGRRGTRLLISASTPSAR